MKLFPSEVLMHTAGQYIELRPPHSLGKVKAMNFPQLIMKNYKSYQEYTEYITNSWREYHEF